MPVAQRRAELQHGPYSRRVLKSWRAKSKKPSERRSIRDNIDVGIRSSRGTRVGWRRPFELQCVIGQPFCPAKNQTAANRNADQAEPIVMAPIELRNRVGV